MPHAERPAEGDHEFTQEGKKDKGNLAETSVTPLTATVDSTDLACEVGVCEDPRVYTLCPKISLNDPAESSMMPSKKSLGKALVCSSPAPLSLSSLCR